MVLEKLSGGCLCRQGLRVQGSGTELRFLVVIEIAGYQIIRGQCLVMRSKVDLMLSKGPDDSTRGHHQMVNTEIRLIIFFAAKDGEALYSQQKQDQELTVAQIMNSLLPNSD